MTRKRQVAGNNLVVAGSPTWTDYDGDSLYGDYGVNIVNGEAQAVETVSYLPGIGEKDLASGAIVYSHADQVGSLRVATDATGNVVGRYVYTAFGELVYEDGGSIGVPPVDSRYGYAGEFGYQEAGATDPLSELGWLHVGHRYYDPACGRFMQRDPIGVFGGPNTYEYLANSPTDAVDPIGLAPNSMNWRWRDLGKSICGGAAAGATAAGLGGGNATGVVAGGLIGGAAGGAKYSGEFAYSCVCDICDNLAEAEANERRNQAQREAHPEIWPPPPPSPPKKLNPYGGEGGGVFCFIAGTPVEAESGPIPIERLGQNDCTLRATGESESPCSSRVLANHASLTRRVVHIFLENEVLTCTPEHPFWVVNRGWTTAAEIKSSDDLLDILGTKVPVLNTESQDLNRPIEVFNLTVGETHEFYVGKSKVLVHNKSV